MTTIFVGNLPFQTSEVELERAFERYGRVATVRIILDRGTGSPRGFAFVNMPGIDNAEEAIARMNGHMMSGRSLIVREARGREESGSSEHSGSSQSPRRSALLDLL